MRSPHARQVDPGFAHQRPYRFRHGAVRRHGVHLVAEVAVHVRSRGVARFTRVDDDSFSWQSTNREADGAALPDTPAVVLKRQPKE